MRRTAAYDHPLVRFLLRERLAPNLAESEAILPCPVCRGEWGECEACFGDGEMTARRAAEVN